MISIKLEYIEFTLNILIFLFSLYGIHGYEDSPFMYISQEGKPEILELLINKHPCLNKYDEDDKNEKVITVNRGYFRRPILDYHMGLHKVGAPLIQFIGRSCYYLHVSGQIVGCIFLI